MTGLSAEGGIDVRVNLSDGVVAGIAITNRRLLTITQALVGKSGDEAAGLAARLFSLCRIAQGLAAATAVERARGGATQHGGVRRQLILGETVLEHTSRAILDWAWLADEMPSLEALKSLRRALADFHQAFYPDGDWMRPGGGRLAVDAGALRTRLAVVGEVLQRAVFGGAPPLDGPSWAAWLADGRTVAARLLRRLNDEGLAGFGASAVASLPAFDETLLDSRLAADDGRFTACPDWQGQVFVTGPLARWDGHPLVSAIVAEHGRGLMAHFAARLVELAMAAREIQDFSPASCNDAALPSASPHGLAVVEAARGRLVHRVELREGTVMRYQILAPTEWNFHPRGPLVDGLRGLRLGNEAMARARLLIGALDPCVACAVEVA